MLSMGSMKQENPEYLPSAENFETASVSVRKFPVDFDICKKTQKLVKFTIMKFEKNIQYNIILNLLVSWKNW